MSIRIALRLAVALRRRGRSPAGGRLANTLPGVRGMLAGVRTMGLLTLIVAAFACGDSSRNESANDVEECVEHPDDRFGGLGNAESPWAVNSDCEEIFVCADASAAQTLNELLGVQCRVRRGAGYCNVAGEVQCILATEVVVTEQHLTDACTALTVPGIDEVVCAKF
jgi:hypothetical protein